MLGRLFKRGPVRGGRHRDVQGSAARAGVLGAGDGLITNISLILGVAGASTSATAVRVAGIAGLLAGAFSMAAGELVSVRAHDDLVRHEIDVEREEITDDPVGEQRELAAMYRARGVPPDDAETVARILMANPDVALDTHSRLELGIDPDDPGSSMQAAAVSFVSFSSRCRPPTAALVLHQRDDRRRRISCYRGISCSGPGGGHRFLLGPRSLADGGSAAPRRRRGRIRHVWRGSSSAIKDLGEGMHPRTLNPQERPPTW